MGFLAELDSGRYGVRLAFPSGFEPGNEGASSALLVDHGRAIGWYVGFYPCRLDLRPENHERLLRDVERHTRALFDTYFHSAPRSDGDAPRAERPRTEDAGWSPVVDVERAQVGGAEALIVIHRLSYGPGDEQIMGHLLVPLRRGLFELRLVARANPTGLRESVLVTRAMAEASGDDPVLVVQKFRQQDFDDSRHDALFPTHPLSLIRADLRRVCEGKCLEVLEPAPEEPAGEVVLPELGFALTPPPRFRKIDKGEAPKGLTQFSRMSFAGTDGLELLTVMRAPELGVPPQGRRDRLKGFVESAVRESTPEGASEIETETRLLPDAKGRAQVEGYARHVDSNGPRHNLFRGLAGEGAGAIFVMSAPGCVPKQELCDEMRGIVDGWRPLESEGAGTPSATKKPWWKLW